MIRSVCILIGVLITAQAPAQAPWKTDWSAFAGVLSTSLKRGASVAELESQFGKQQVTWVGVLNETQRITDKEMSVWMTMPPEKITLADGSTLTISFLGLSAMGGDVKKWEKVAAGSTVRFRTTLKGNTGYPVVAVMPGVNVIISTEGAEFVEVIKK